MEIHFNSYVEDYFITHSYFSHLSRENSELGISTTYMWTTLSKMYDQQKMHFLILLVFWAEEIIAITGSSSIPQCRSPDKCVCANNGTEIICEQSNSFSSMPVFDRDVGSQGASMVRDL